MTFHFYALLARLMLDFSQKCNALVLVSKRLTDNLPSQYYGQTSSHNQSTTSVVYTHTHSLSFVFFLLHNKHNIMEISSGPFFTTSTGLIDSIDSKFFIDL